MIDLLLFGVLVILFMSAHRARPVLADLKCGDAPPVRFGDDGLVIAWTGPVPANARVTITNREPFKRVSEALGSSLPDDLPRKFLENQHATDVFNASMAFDENEVMRWNERHGMKMSDEPLGLFREYLDGGDYVIFQSLVEHPSVSDFERFSACSVVFQRGDIYMSRGSEHLFLRSYFHSANDSGEFVNIVPAGGLQMSFKTKTLWYPLRVTKLNREATTVVLNIFTHDPLDKAQIPENFRVENTGRLLNGGIEQYAATRVSASFDGGQDVPDFELAV